MIPSGGRARSSAFHTANSRARQHRCRSQTDRRVQTPCARHSACAQTPANAKCFFRENCRARQPAAAGWLHPGERKRWRCTRVLRQIEAAARYPRGAGSCSYRPATATWLSRELEVFRGRAHRENLEAQGVQLQERADPRERGASKTLPRRTPERPLLQCPLWSCGSCSLCDAPSKLTLARGTSVVQ